MNGMRASYSVVLAAPDVVVIRDRRIGMTITNDAEAVVKDLLAKGVLKTGMRLHYYDTDGRLDELLFDENGFKDFSFARPEESVKTRLLAMGMHLLLMVVPSGILFGL